MFLPSVAVLVTLAAQAPADSDGAALYQAWCSKCHGADGRGKAAATARLAVPPADLQECKASTAEPEARWIGIVTHGGAAFGLSLDMPAFGEAGTPAQVRAVVRYARSLCGELGWPPGELNFPRPFLVEKAFPENEWVVTAAGRQQPGRALFVQGEIVASWEETEGIAAFSYRLGVGREVGRVVPMLEAGWTVPLGGERTLALYPQMWVQLSRLGHVAASLGADLPAV